MLIVLAVLVQNMVHGAVETVWFLVYPAVYPLPLSSQVLTLTNYMMKCQHVSVELHLLRQK